MEPRDWLVHPEHFGRIRDTAWKPAPIEPRQRALVSASYWQHTFCCAAEAERLAQEKTWDVVAKLAGIDPGTLGKVRLGHRPMTLAIMIGVVRSLGKIELLPSPLSIKQLLPETGGGAGRG